MHLLTGSYITMILYVVVARQRHTIFGVGVVMAVQVAKMAPDEVMG
jgi:hypothetical protein